MKKNFFITIALALVMMFCVGQFSGCFDNDDVDGASDVNELELNGTIYNEGEQSVTLRIAERAENPTTFKSTVSAAEITFSGVLEGKTIKSVTYVDESSIALTVDGTVTADNPQAQELGTTVASKALEKELGMITVSKKAFENNKEGNCYLRVNFDPCLNCNSASCSTYSGIYRSTFTLPYGSYIEENVTLDNINIPIVNDGMTATVSLDADGKLFIEVKGFVATDEFKYPMAQIGANVSTVNKSYLVYIGIFNSYSAS
jgi:hypothetical protein